MTTATSYFYCVPSNGTGGPLYDSRLEDCDDRHRITLQRPSLIPVGDEGTLTGDLVIELVFGWASRAHLRWAKRALQQGRRVWFYWPREGAVEFIDSERLASYRRLWLYVRIRHAATAGRHHFLQAIYQRLPESIRPIARSAYRKVRALRGGVGAGIYSASPDEIRRAVATHRHQVQAIADAALPVPLDVTAVPSPNRRVSGTGAYLRTDFWARINTGGSYGHTCYVAKELAATTEQFMCFLPHRYVLLDDIGVPQRVMDGPGANSSEFALIQANNHYYALLKPLFQEQKPAYIYERLCLGNFVAARLSAELGIPYIVEYNGSEISMTRSFAGSSYEHEEFFIAAEDAAFRQATLISVVSDAVGQDLVRRGVPAEKILVNPNGVDLDAYTPLEPAKRRALRQELGYSDDDRVVGFIGTFGGWHGIDVLAEALPKICQSDARIRFLLIGDGNLKHLVDTAVRDHDLGSQVRCTGRVAHHEGARLLGACDIYTSPHSSHMVDSRFFGSPTKLFEYMAMGGGIVGSDLEQIGEVLSPAIRAADIGKVPFSISDQRAVLCKPGSVEQFVQAVLFLARSPQLCEALGRNARAAAAAHFSWRRHVERLWELAVRVRSGVAVTQQRPS